MPQFKDILVKGTLRILKKVITSALEVDDLKVTNKINDVPIVDYITRLDVDNELDSESINPIQNKIVKWEKDIAATKAKIKQESDPDYLNDYKEDLKILDDFCSKFDFKSEFSTVLRQLLRQGVFYCVLREDSNKYTLQELPPDFCKITGRHAYGLLFDFNMNWFIGNYGVDINMYPKVFKRMYKQVFDKIAKSYNPHMPVDRRSSTFVYWHQCSPSDGFWAWKISPEIATIVPYFSPMFPDMGFQPTVRKLQNDKYFIEASKLLVGIIGFNKEAKSGQVSNQINITPDILGKFLGVARQGLNKQIGLVALPVDSIESVDFTVDQNNIVTDYIKSLSQQGLSSADILMTDNKLNSHQSKLASAVDGNFIKSVYSMFSNFVDYFVNTKTKKYKFHVAFHDIDVPDDRAEREARFKTTASMGIVDVQYAARMFDLNPFEFNRRLSMSKASGFENKLISLMSLNNQSANSLNEKGRPQKPNSDSDSTEASWARGSNELK